jgi:hypothetical protein
VNSDALADALSQVNVVLVQHEGAVAIASSGNLPAHVAQAVDDAAEVACDDQLGGPLPLNTKAAALAELLFAGVADDVQAALARAQESMERAAQWSAALCDDLGG